MTARTLLALAAATTLAAPRTAFALQALTPLPLRSGEVVVDVRATTVNDFDVRAPVAQAEFRGTDLSNVTGHLEVRVADLRSGIGRRDRHLRGAMNADSFPVIRFELIGVDSEGATGDSLPVAFQGRITLHGVTRMLRIPGTIVRRLTAIDVAIVRFPLDMREYGITPPARFMGAIRVQPDVHVNVRMVFGN